MYELCRLTFLVFPPSSAFSVEDLDLWRSLGRDSEDPCFQLEQVDVAVERRMYVCGLIRILAVNTSILCKVSGTTV